MDENDQEPKGGISDLTKNIISLGLGAYFLTEEKIVGMVRDSKLPRDIGSSITGGASRAKDELYGFVTREISTLLKKVDIQDEIRKALVNNKIKITAEIEFLPHSDSDSSGTRSTVTRVVDKDNPESTKIHVETTIDPKSLDPKTPEADTASSDHTE